MSYFKDRRGMVRVGILLPLILLSTAFFLFNSNALQRLDGILYDHALQLWERPAPSDIVIIAIDEQSLAELGRWPWPREKHAQLIDKLGDAKVVGLNVLFSEADPANSEGDRLLAEAIHKHARVVMPVTYLQTASSGLLESLPLPEFSVAAAGLGHVNLSWHCP